MSFILDALKKSESDRQRQSGPSLFEVKVAPPRRRLPVWAVAIAVLLAINVIVISWMLFRHAPAQQPAVATPPPAVSPPTATPAKTLGASHSAGESAPANVTADAAPAGNSVPARAAAPAASSATSQGATSQAGSDQISTAPLSSPAGQSAGPPSAATGSSDNAPAIEPAAAQGSGSSAGTGALPIYQQIVTTAGLPALHLDLHVYAQNPKDRFVMINMHRLGEGDSLPDGVRVEAIRPDGVVLSYRGTQFLLPRD